MVEFKTVGLQEIFLFQHLSDVSGVACFQTIGLEKEALEGDSFPDSQPRVKGSILPFRIDPIVTLGGENVNTIPMM